MLRRLLIQILTDSGNDGKLFLMSLKPSAQLQHRKPTTKKMLIFNVTQLHVIWECIDEFKRVWTAYTTQKRDFSDKMRLCRELRQVAALKGKKQTVLCETRVRFQLLSCHFFIDMRPISNWYHYLYLLKAQKGRHNPVSLASLTVQPLTDGDRLTSRWGENEVRRQRGKSS